MVLAFIDDKNFNKLGSSFKQVEKMMKASVILKVVSDLTIAKHEPWKNPIINVIGPMVTRGIA